MGIVKPVLLVFLEAMSIPSVTLLPTYVSGKVKYHRTEETLPAFSRQNI